MLGALTMKPRGFTLIELMITLSVLGVLVAIAGPSMYDFVLTQRLRSINAQLVTDLQFARSEAATHNRFAYVRFNEVAGSVSCYVVYTGPLQAGCNCTRTPVCGETSTLLRTVALRADSKLRLRHVNGAGDEIASFDPKNGSMNVLSADTLIPQPVPFSIEAAIDSARTLRTVVTPAGRPAVCAPSGSSLSGATACPAPPPP
jgi:type IV fimbrial biogenesis protein FimT